MTTADSFPSFVTLFLVVDPVGLAPLFIALTQGRSGAARRAIGARACIVAAVVLALFGLFGAKLLGFVGISMAAFRIAGGALLFLTALDMLFERRSKRREGHAESERGADDPSVFPLATPLIAGPGAIATMILLTGRAPDPTILDRALPLVVMLAVMAVTWLFFLASGIIERLLGATGIQVVTRLLGMLLAALAVQFMLDGIADFGVIGGALPAGHASPI